MYGIIKQNNCLRIIPMEYVKISNDKIIATGIKDKTTAQIIINKINGKIKLDR